MRASRLSWKESDTEEKVREIIDGALSAIPIPALRTAARVSLLDFYRRERRASAALTLSSAAVFLSLLKIGTRRGIPSPKALEVPLSRMSMRGAYETLTAYDGTIDFHNIATNNLRKYTEDYYRENIKPTLSRMEKEEALDPDAENYLGRRQSLLARAEREVRYKAHLDETSDLRARGVRLVLISAHANCSERCRPFQGRVFSLDGSEGVTEDGRYYEPLERATDIYTKNGKWKNGLFGFNCRHTMTEYKTGESAPRVSPKEEEREYRIDLRMRSMERTVRKWRAAAEMSLSAEEGKKARQKASAWAAKYRAYAATHGRAFQPSRLKIR